MTTIDVQLVASAYYPLLVEVAKRKQWVNYGELVALAKGTYPDQPAVQTALPVSTGRRLDVVRLFTAQREMPDLTSLVVNKGSGECGSGFTRSFDPVAARAAVFAFDWGAVTTAFEGFVRQTEAEIRPRKRLAESKALDLMASYYKEHKADLPASIRQQRELIIELIMDGFSVEEAFAEAGSSHVE